MGYYVKIIKLSCLFIIAYCLIYLLLQPFFTEKIDQNYKDWAEASEDSESDSESSSEAPESPEQPLIPNSNSSDLEIKKILAENLEFTFFNGSNELYDDDPIEPLINDTDGYIINSYYYPSSKSLGENALAMVLLLNANTLPEITNYNLTLLASNGTDEVLVNPVLTKEVYDSCAFVNVLAKTNLLPNLQKLEILDGDTKLEIPFRRPLITAPAPVIICITPQFLSEQWQLFIIQAHIARKFGGHIHLSVISMIDTFYQLVKEYQKEGYVTLDYWIRPKFLNASDSLEPNANVEWRNIGGGHTDCLLKYKESADFITFFDLDDVFLPRGFSTYSSEFSVLSVLNPKIRSFHYEKREFMLYRESQLAHINFAQTFGSSYYAPDVMVGKTVAKPKNIDSMWIHKSFNIPDEERLYLKHNFILHLQKPKERGNRTEELEIMKVDFVEMKELMMERKVLEELQSDFERMLSSPRIQSIASGLQKDNYYLPLMYKCYHDRFYKLYNQSWTVQTKLCGNNEDCEIPQRDDLKCVHSDADYVSGPKMSPITFHYHTRPRFNRKVSCSQ